MRTLGIASNPRNRAGWDTWDMPDEKPGADTRRALALFLGITLTLFLGGAALDAAWAASPKKGNTATATGTLEIIQDDTGNKWDYDGSGITTRYRWLGSKGGNLVYCINPGVTHGPFEGESQKLPARLLRASDFKSEALYEACLAALYYAPGGPGYEREDDSTKGLIGARLFPDEDWNGGAFGRKDRFATAHCLMGFYYNDADWDKTYPQASRQPSARYKSFFQRWMIPAAFGGTGSGSYGELALAHFNDEDMLDNGGYTVQAWKESVYLVMSGEDDRQDLLTFVDAPRGPLKLEKRSANSKMTDGNPCYSLAGARYGVYSDNARKREVGTIVTDASGAGSLEALVAGTYYVKELSPGTGYLPDPEVHAVVVRKDSGGSFTSAEPPRHAPLQLLAGKVDAVTKTDAPQGSASLAGAEFTLSRYGGYLDSARALPATAAQTWTVKTDSSGRALKSLELPLGTYAIRETKAPTGYLPDPTVRLLQVVADDSAEHGAKVKPLNYDNAGAKVSYDNPASAPIVPEQPKMCGFTLAKVDAELGTGQAQGDATLAGAVFSVVNDSPNPVTVNGKVYRKGEECLTVAAKEADGTIVAGCAGNTLPFGDYVIREKSAPAGYLPNEGWNARISCTDATEDGHIWELPPNPCPDQVVRGGISVPKIDRELKEGTALGAASLEGAEISITLDSAQPVRVDGTLFSPGEVVKTIVTGADGTAATGIRDLPYGTYTLREEKAPEGYLPNTQWSFTAEVREDGVSVAANPVDDQVKRGDVRFNKASAGDMARMGSVAFLVTSKTTGESHVVVTDENGSLDTSSSWNAHTRKTNGNDGALRVPDGNGASDGEESTPEDEASDGGEASDADTGEDDDTADAVADKDGEKPDGGGTVAVESADAIGDDSDSETGKTSVNAPQEASTDDAPDTQAAAQRTAARLEGALAEALGAESVAIGKPDEVLSAIAKADARVGDEVSFTATVTGEGKPQTRTFIAAVQEDGSISVRDADTDDEVAYIDAADVSGDEDRNSADTPADAADGEGSPDEASAHEVDDNVLDPEAGIWFSGMADRQTSPDDGLGALPYDTYTFRELRGNANEGYEPVSFDVRISRDSTTLDMGTVDDEHAPAPLLSTELLSPEKTHIAPATGTVDLVDAVAYSGSVAGMRYTMHGYLVDKATGKQVGDAASVDFTAKENSGTVEVPLPVEADGLAGRQVVAYQEMLRDEEVVAEHKDLDDAAETVGFPAIATTLTTAAGMKETSTAQVVELVDRVDFAGLEPGVEYTLEATLHAKADDGQDAGVLKDADGAEVTARVLFTPVSSSGTASVPFRFKVPSGLQQAVAFEKLLADGALYAAHEDIGDEAQTVSFTDPPEEPQPKPEPEPEPDPSPTPEEEPAPSKEPEPQPTPEPQAAPEPDAPTSTPKEKTGKATPADTGDSANAFAALTLATIAGGLAQVAAIRRRAAREYREW